MGSKPAPNRIRLEPHHPFRALYRQGGKRWLILLVAIAALVWLGLFAGVVRNPGGIKRQWAVVASRAMAAAGGIILVRLLLFSYEERVPVVYIRPDTGSEEALAGWIGRLQGREDVVVPLSDVVAFMAERRYVPRGGLALVLEAGTIEEAETLASLAGDIKVTILLPARAFENAQGESKQDTADAGGYAGKRRLADSVEIGAALGLDRTSPERLTAALRHFAQRAERHLGKSPVCAATGQGIMADPRSLAEAGGYTCSLGGGGYNRFGDTPYLVGLLDISPVLRHGRATGLNVRIYTEMFKGGYIWWPVAALLKAFAASPGW